jgi:hypothetical protein
VLRKKSYTPCRFAKAALLRKFMPDPVATGVLGESGGGLDQCADPELAQYQVFCVLGEPKMQKSFSQKDATDHFSRG